MTEWVQMLVTMADGPRQQVHGTVVPYRNSEEPFHYYLGTYGEEPVFLPYHREGLRLYRWGRRSRIESLGGGVLFVSDGDTAWDFTSDPHRPRCTALHRVHSLGSDRCLVVTPRVEHWVGSHHARPAGPVTDLEFLGRSCWSVDLAAGERRGRPRSSLRLVVDADTGTVLAQHSGDGVDGAAYTDLTVDESPDPSLFVWSGPVVSDEESRDRAGNGGHSVTRHENDLQWFRENVTADPVLVPMLSDFTPSLVDRVDRESGDFSALLGADERTGWLVRRRRSSEPWPVKAHGNQIVWSTRDFDWAFQWYRGTLGDDGLALLQRQLHPDEPAEGAPHIVFAGSNGP